MLHEKTHEDYVNDQAADMVAELKAHEQEKGAPGAWLEGDPTEWLHEAQQQLLKLGDALDHGTPDGVKKRAAHVCNFVMMAAQTALMQR